MPMSHAHSVVLFKFSAGEGTGKWGRHMGDNWEGTRYPGDLLRHIDT